MKLIEVLTFHTRRYPKKVGILHMLDMVEISYSDIHCGDFVIKKTSRIYEPETNSKIF